MAVKERRAGLSHGGALIDAAFQVKIPGLSEEFRTHRSGSSVVMPNIGRDSLQEALARVMRLRATYETLLWD